MKISHTVDIHSTPEKVFHWLNNPERARAWMTSVAKTEILYEAPDMVGTTFREIVAENGQETELRGVVTDYRPNQLIAFHLSGRFNVVDVAYYLEEVANGTRLIQRADIRFKAFLKLLSIFVGPMLKQNIMAQSKKEFARLKELCEQDVSG